jgi:type III restriction enzyme
MRGIGPDYIQIVEIIGTQKFEEFVKQLEVEGVGVGVTKEPPSLGKHVYPMKIKGEFNIEIPILSPVHTRELQSLDASILKDLPLNPRGITITEGAITKVSLVETVTQQTVAQKQVTIDTGIPDINEILTHLTNRISKEARIDGHFADIYPILKKYVKEMFFGQEVKLEHESVRRHLTDARNAGEIVSTLAKKIGDVTIVKILSKLKPEPLSLLELDGFYWKRDWVELDKTVFNITPCYNDFETHFARFLDQAVDINKFAKLAETYTKFSIEYLNHRGAISYYYPDFIAEQLIDNGANIMWLIETKGWEKPDVKLKDQRVVQWCKDATELTDTDWRYLKVNYNDYLSLTNNLNYIFSKDFEGFLKRLAQLKSDAQMELN